MICTVYICVRKTLHSSTPASPNMCKEETRTKRCKQFRRNLSPSLGFVQSTPWKTRQPDAKIAKMAGPGLLKKMSRRSRTIQNIEYTIIYLHNIFWWNKCLESFLSDKHCRPCRWGAEKRAAAADSDFVSNQECFWNILLPRRPRLCMFSWIVENSGHELWIHIEELAYRKSFSFEEWILGDFGATIFLQMGFRFSGPGGLTMFDHHKPVIIMDSSFSQPSM